MSAATVLMPDPYSAEWDDFADWLCTHLENEGCDRTFAITIELLEERGHDVEATLALFESKGGYCDCEVLFNVDPPTLDDELDMFREMSR
jgi:hypothetical protein